MVNLISRIVGKVCHVGASAIGSLLPKKGVVYMLHEVSDSGEDLCVTEAELERFLSSLDRNKLIDLAEWSDKSDFVAITIDDVPENFYWKGFPLLKKYRLPFTLFVSTSLLDTPGFITTEQLREMADCDLCTVGSHGTLHEFYKNFSHEEKIRFLEDSQKELSVICGRPVELFAFPYGSVYACGFKDKKLVSRYYKYGFGTIGTNLTSFRLLPKYFLPRENLSSGLIHRIYE